MNPKRIRRHALKHDAEPGDALNDIVRLGKSGCLFFILLPFGLALAYLWVYIRS